MEEKKKRISKDSPSYYLPLPYAMAVRKIIPDEEVNAFLYEGMKLEFKVIGLVSNTIAITAFYNEEEHIAFCVATLLHDSRNSWTVGPLWQTRAHRVATANRLGGGDASGRRSVLRMLLLWFLSIPNLVDRAHPGSQYLDLSQFHRSSPAMDRSRIDNRRDQ